MKPLNIPISITDKKPIAIYLKEITKIKVLPEKEQNELALKARKGDQKAFDQLVTSNLRFVVSVAKQYQGQGVPFEDLINDGNIGLMDAARKFDPGKGIKFISYAVWHIRNIIMRGIYEKSRIMRLPMSKIIPMTKIYNGTTEFEQKYGRKPNDYELEEITGIDKKDIHVMENCYSTVTSIDSEVVTDSQGSKAPLIEAVENKNAELPDENSNKESFDYNIDSILHFLPDRSSDIVRMLFGVGCKQMMPEDVADMFDISAERVCQLKNQAIKKLSKKSNMIKRLVYD